MTQLSGYNLDRIGSERSPVESTAPLLTWTLFLSRQMSCTVLYWYWNWCWLRAGAQVRAAVDGARGPRARGDGRLDGLLLGHHEPGRVRGRQARRARPPRVYAPT
jgi:hypothetical protein